MDKKFYLEPEMDILEMELNSQLLAGSINDEEENPIVPTTPGEAGDDDLV